MIRLQRRVYVFIVLILVIWGILRYVINKGSNTSGGPYDIIDSFVPFRLNNGHNEKGSGRKGANFHGNTVAGKSGSSSGSIGKTDIPLEPCTAWNPTSHQFIDLSSLSATGNEGKPLPWTLKGYDSGLNFTFGICSNPFKRLHQSARDVKDIEKTNRVGGYYIDPKLGMYVSIGDYSTQPQVRGKKIVLTYLNGSYCENVYDSTGARIRKSSIISFICDREIMTRASASFVGSVNDCSYFFEVRSHHACPTAAKEDNLAVLWIFFFIFLSAFLVYLFGASLYKMVKQPAKAAF